MIPVRFFARVLLTGLLAGSTVTITGARAETPADGTIVLPFHHAPWTAAVFGREASGHLGWLEGPDRSLRLELGRGLESMEAGQLLSQSGEGWTVVLGPDDEGTVNGWGKEWRPVEPGLGQLVRAAVVFLSEAGMDGSSRRIQIPDLMPRGPGSDRQGSFRRELVRRGRGRGGLGEIVVLTRNAQESESPWVFEIRSTRRPGRVRLELPVPLGLECPVPEVFLPLWPLSDLTTTTPEIPGTSTAGEG